MNTEIAKLISRHCSSKETYEKYVDVMQKVEAVYNPDANLQEILDCKQSFEDALQLIGQCKGIYSQYPHNSHQILNEAFYLLSQARINRKEFYQKLSQIDEALEVHRNSLYEELNKTGLQLNKEFEAFIASQEESEKLSPLVVNILSTIEVKDIIMDFLTGDF